MVIGWVSLGSERMNFLSASLRSPLLFHSSVSYLHSPSVGYLPVKSRKNMDSGSGYSPFGAF